jgi:uncharacterized repeat protein (TIGR02543 family)
MIKSTIFKIFAVMVFITTLASAQQQTRYVITNPYSGVNWASWGQYKAAHHTHSTYSDGSNTRRDMLIDKYNKNFDIVAMTDHDVLTDIWWQLPNPSTGNWNSIGTGVLTEEEQTAFNDGSALGFRGKYMGRRQQTNGMIGMGGSNEWTASNEPVVNLGGGGTAPFGNHHINTFFANLPQSAISSGQRTLAKIIEEAEKLGGISHLNHPGRYTGGQTNAAMSADANIIARYVGLFEKYPSLVGMEIINKWDGESVNDRILWDNILKETMELDEPRLVWGFSNDDSHSLSGNGHAWNVMLMPALTEDATKTSMITGAFYGVSRIDRHYNINDKLGTGGINTPGAPAQTTTTATQYTGGTHNDMALALLKQPVPSITSITVNAKDGTITIAGDNIEKVDWVINGESGIEIIHTGLTLDLGTELNANGSRYVRAVVVGEHGVAYTQPFGLDEEGEEITINPYKDVVWTGPSAWGQYKAAHHTHSTYSDGSNTRKDMLIDKYNKGFDIVAMTDHDVLTTAWDQDPDPATGDWNSIGRAVLSAPEMTAINAGTYTGLRTNSNGMISMGGSNEWTASNEPVVNLVGSGTANFSGHHINTFFANLPQASIIAGERTLANIIGAAQTRGGISHLNHPGRYTGAQHEPERSSDANIIERYVDLFTRFPSLVGMEIINKWDGESVNDRILWDNILKETMPQGRFVYGFSNDDSHSLSGNGHAWNVMLMPTLTPAATKTSMETGAFYGVSRIDRHYGINDKLGAGETATPGAPEQTTASATQYSGGTHNDMALGLLAQTVPSISNITVNEENGTITITGSDYEKIEWIADGKVIYTGATLNIGNHSEINSYVRAVVIGEHGIAYTQPFGIKLRHTVSFLDEDGTTKLSTDQNVNPNTVATEPRTEPTKTGHTFAGWFNGAATTAWDFDTPINADLTLTAKWTINSYTVTFKALETDTEALEEKQVSHGAGATAPADPTRTGYTFDDWDKAFDNITSDLTVLAQWTINSYTVTFKALETDTEALKEEQVNHGANATTPIINPTRTGYTFAGWAPVFTSVTSNLTVLAQWTSINSYTVTFKALEADTEALKEEQVNHGGNAIAPIINPTRTGYTFTGWDPVFTNVTSDLTVLAQWELAKTSIINVYPQENMQYTPTYYNLHGKPLGTTKPTVPGVYIEKQGKQTKRIMIQ